MKYTLHPQKVHTHFLSLFIAILLITLNFCSFNTHKYTDLQSDIPRYEYVIHWLRPKRVGNVTSHIVVR
jgi:hypothetical protein